jgi:hypothetical protein
MENNDEEMKIDDNEGNDFMKIDSIGLAKKGEIIQLISIFAKNYNCKESQVSFKFKPMYDDNGDLNLRIIRLSFYINEIKNYEYTERNIYNLTVLIPAAVREKYLSKCLSNVRLKN